MTTRKMIYIGGGGLVAALLAGGIYMKINQPPAPQPEPEIEVTQAPTITPYAGGTVIAEDDTPLEYVPSEDTLTEALAFHRVLAKQNLQTEVREAIVEESTTSKPADVISQILDFWNYDTSTIKDKASEQLLKSAGDAVDKLTDEQLKDRLSAILEKAREQLSKRSQITPTPVPTVSQAPATPSVTPVPVQSQSVSVMPTVMPTPVPTRAVPTPVPAVSTPSTVTSNPVSTTSNPVSTPTQTVSTPVYNPVVTQAPVITYLPEEIPEYELYDWVSDDTAVSMTPIVDDGFPYWILSYHIQDSLDYIREEIATGTEDIAVLPDPGYTAEDVATLMQAIHDIYYPYSGLMQGAVQDNGSLQIYEMNAARIEFANNVQLHAKAGNLAKSVVTKGTSEKQAVIDLHNFLLSYMDTGVGLLNAVDSGIGTDRDYANLFKDMLLAVGIPARLDYGTIGSDTENHAWVIVTVNGQEYYIDPVYNDLYGNGDEWPKMFSPALWSGYAESYRGTSVATNAVLEATAAADQLEWIIVPDPSDSTLPDTTLPDGTLSDGTLPDGTQTDVSETDTIVIFDETIQQDTQPVVTEDPAEQNPAYVDFSDNSEDSSGQEYVYEEEIIPEPEIPVEEYTESEFVSEPYEFVEVPEEELFETEMIFE